MDEREQDRRHQQRRERDRRDRLAMLAISLGSALVIAIVLYFAGAFRRSTG